MQFFSKCFLTWSAAVPFALATAITLLLVVAFGRDSVDSMILVSCLFAGIAGLTFIVSGLLLAKSRFRRDPMRTSMGFSRIVFAGASYALITFASFGLFLALDDRSYVGVGMQMLASSLAAGVTTFVIPERLVSRRRDLGFFLGLLVAAFGTLLAWEMGMG